MNAGSDTVDFAQARDAGIPRRLKWFVRCFLIVFVLCAIFGIELWPLTGFRLFSHVRYPETSGWVASAVWLSGSTTDLALSDLPRAYQGFGLIMQGFPTLSAIERESTCEVWLAEARRVWGPIATLQLYETTWDEELRSGDRPAQVQRKLAFECS
jgi:hypothetical protein